MTPQGAQPDNKGENTDIQGALADNLGRGYDERNSSATRRFRQSRYGQIIGEVMAEKLQQSDRFPSVTLKLLDGGTIRIPEEAPGRYSALLFYRGHW